MKTLYITIDDCRSLSLTSFLFECKEIAPNLKLTLFVTPCWKGKSDIRRAGTFAEFVKSTSNWIEFAGHGFDHSYPPECLADRETQQKMFRSSYQALSGVGIVSPGFKPPGYHCSTDSPKLSAEFFSYFITQYQIIQYKPNPKLLHLPPEMATFHAGAKWLEDSLGRQNVRDNLKEMITKYKSFGTVKEWIKDNEQI